MYKRIYKNLNSRSFGNAISYLKNNNIITEIGEEKYYLITKKVYEFKEDIKENKMYKIINSGYPNIKFTIWNTSILNDFTLHYVINNYMIIEVEKIEIELIVNLLKEKYINKYTIVTQEMFISNSQLFLNNEKLLIIKPYCYKEHLCIEMGIENIQQ